MAETASGPRAAQIQAVRDVMGWGPQPDEFNDRAVADAAAELVDAVLEAGNDQGDESICHRCSGPNIIWSAPSPLWNAVMRGGSIMGTELHGGIVCPPCFAKVAEERGIAGRMWRLTAEVVHVELETVTPSGRVWDEQAWLWREPGDAQFVDAVHAAGRDDHDRFAGQALHDPEVRASYRRDAEARGYRQAIDELRGVVQRTGSPAARWAADYLEAVGPDGTADIVHQCPTWEEATFTPCCGRTPFELPRLDRLTTDPAQVTCRANVPAGPRAHSAPEQGGGAL